MSLVTRFEKNSLRKSYRTTIPLQVVLDGKSYNAIDWSLTGLALEIPNFQYSPGDKIDAQLILPILDAKLSLPVTLFYEYNYDNRNGFSFIDLSEKHKNVLRRFIEMAIEGKIDRVDDIVAVYEEPEITTPIQTPVTLQEEEAHELKRSFVRTSARYLLFAASVIGFLGLVIFYNLRYIYEGSGVVTGNDMLIYPTVNAFIEKIYVHEGDVISPGMPLVQLDSSAVRFKLALLEIDKKRNRDLFSQKQQHLREQRTMYQKMITLARRQIAKSRISYRNAKKQYTQRLIMKSTLRQVENDYLQARQNLAKIKLLPVSVVEANSSVIQNTLDLEKADVKLEYLKKQLPLYHIEAPVKGKVYEIYGQEGQEALKNNPLMLIWTEDTPYITATVPIKFLAHIVTGTEVDIIDKNDDVVLHGKVFKIGSLTDIIPQSDTFTVSIRPENPASHLKPHQRVQLLFKRDFFRL